MSPANGRDVDVDDIRRQMAQIRRELHEDMQGVVAGAEAASDWHYYVRHYPIPALIGAAVVGYLLVPKRKPSPAEVAEETAEDLTDRIERAVRAAQRKATRWVGRGEAPPQVDEEPPPVEKKKRKAGLVGMLFGMAAPVALRAAQNYASHLVENWIAQQQAAGLGPTMAGGMPPNYGTMGPGATARGPQSAGPNPAGPRPGPIPGRPPGPGAGPR